LYHGRCSRERDDADADVFGQLLDEGLGGGLRGSDAIGLDVGREHAARDIDREHYRLLLRGQENTVLGRAIATTAASSAQRNSSGGTWRRQLARPIASRMSWRLAY
jgi:hypothetical protein